MPSPMIRATRAEISERFPLLGFTVRTGSKPYFEVVLTTDPELLAATARATRTSETFWSTRCLGPLAAQRGEAVFIVPDAVTQRFAGKNRIYYSVATFSDKTWADPELLRLPAEITPYVSVSPNFTGRRLRQLVGATAPGTRWNGGGGGDRYTETVKPSLDWAGDAAAPGIQATAQPSGAKTNGSGAPAAGETTTAALQYDDSYSPDLWKAPTERRAAPARGVISRAAEEAEVSEQSFDVTWSGVELVPQLTDMSCWAAAAAMVVGWRDQISIDPSEIANGTGYWAAYHEGLNPADVSELRDTFNLVSQGPQSYAVDGFLEVLESSGPLWIAASTPGAHVVVVTGMYGDGTADGTFVRINDPWGRPTSPTSPPGQYNPTPGAGSRYELSYREFMAEYESLAGEPGVGIQILHTKPEDMGGRVPMTTAQAYSIRTAPSPARLRARTGRAQVGPAVIPIATTVLGATMSRILSNEGDVKWELDQLKGLKVPGDDRARAGEGNFDTHVTRVENWPKVENLLTDEISADFEIRWQSNGHSLGNVDIVPIHSNDAVGHALEVKATINNDAHVYDGDVAALFVRFQYRFTRPIGPDALAVTEITLKADGSAEFTRQEWTQEPDFASESQGMSVSRAQSAEVIAAIVSPIVETTLEMITKSLEDDVTTELPRLKGWKHVNDDPANAVRPNASTLTTPISGPEVVNHLPEFMGDRIGCDLLITWAHDGRSVGEIQVRPSNARDTAGWALRATGEVYDDPQAYKSADGQTCAAVRLLFTYNFTRVLGSPIVNNFDVILYGNGAVEVRNQ